jgi:hypothetical protein
MSLLGKILAVLNVLAAVGFFFVAYMDWNMRQSWANAVVQHDIVINGLPVDKSELDQEGHPKYLNLRKAMLQPLLGAQIVRTQEEEVDQVRNKLQVPTSFEDRTQKVVAVKKLASILMALADQQKQREDLLKRVDEAQAAATKATAGDAQADKALQDELDKMQTEVADDFNKIPQEPPDDPNEGPRDDKKDSKRRAIAHLLFRLVPVLGQDDTPEKQQAPDLGPPNPAAVGPGVKVYDRYLAVVGLEAASRELDNQAATLQVMAEDVLHGMERDRDGFLDAQRTMLAQLEDLSERDARQKTFLANQQDLVQRQNTIVDTRKTELKKVKDLLSAAQGYTRDDLKAQAVLEKNLFEARKNMRDAFEKNQELEKQIRTLEKVR